MGVPAFFRWLTVRYPKVVIDALSEDDLEDLQNEFAQDPNEVNLDDALAEATRLNQNSKARNSKSAQVAANNPVIDNLYLDMNGIIHPCAHPQNGGPQPKSEQEIFDNIYAYTDKIIKLVKPRKLIYFAIDGVAPRAKMNQQRARRFRAARDAEEDALRQANIKQEWADRITYADDENKGDYKFDSNVITPGTEFMHRLSIALKSYLVERANNDPMWKDLVFIFSDAFVPGEGEHKILDFIRSQRAQPGYEPNKSHCIYGADADLIMLGLSTHEAHFFVLRECVMQVNSQTCYKCKQVGHMSFECGTEKANKVKLAKAVEFQFVKIAVVREYLELEFKDVDVKNYDFERIVDDFVFLCFLVGNDFLPHLPSLQIREGALDAILVIYKNQLPKIDGYLTEEGKIVFKNVDVIFKDISKLEEEQFKQQYYKAQRQKDQKGRGGNGNNYRQNNNPQNLGLLTNDQTASGNLDPELLAKRAAKEKLEKEMERPDLTEEEKAKLAKDMVKQEAKRLADAKNTAKVDAYVDKVKLGVDGWKMRYYTNKFLITDPADVPEFVEKIKQSYIEGLQWVLAYYYKGCESWDWYYEYHYAPFASDLANCADVQVEFQMGQPRRPFEQLMCVFPKQSAHALPKCYHWLMSDSKSPIIDFYPISFRLDVNGAAYAWMGVNLLPFIDQERLFKAMLEADQDQQKLSPQEQQRNKRTGDICLFYNKGDQSALRRNQIGKGQEYSAAFSSLDEVAGTVIGLGQQSADHVIMSAYNHPEYAKHSTQLMPGAKLPRREVEDFEIYQVERKFFQGENAIRMVEQLLNIPPTQFNQYKKYGYQNSHATFEKPSQQSGSHLLGKRPAPQDNTETRDTYQRQRTDQAPTSYTQNRQQMQGQSQQKWDQFQQHNYTAQQLIQQGQTQVGHPYNVYQFESFGNHQQRDQQPQQQPFGYHQPPSYQPREQHGYPQHHQSSYQPRYPEQQSRYPEQRPNRYDQYQQAPNRYDQYQQQHPNQQGYDRQGQQGYAPPPRQQPAQAWSLDSIIGQQQQQQQPRQQHPRRDDRSQNRFNGM